MTTTITPGTGQGALFTQQGPGTSPGFSAIDVRRALSISDSQEGVYGASDFMVVQRAAGANMSVDVGMPAGGFALVQGDSVSGQGLYTVPVHSATINEAVTAAHATLPRVDQVILEVLDNVHDVSGLNQARVRVLTGTATSGATLDNRTGAAALPGSALLLADFLVGAAATTIPNTVIRDRRKWARGAYVTTQYTGATLSTTSTTPVQINSGLLKRAECSGAPVRLRFHAVFSNATAGTQITFYFYRDGASAHESFESSPGGSGYLIVDTEIIVTPAAGSHTFDAYWATAAGTVFGYGGGGAVRPIEISVEELVRQNTANNATTSG